jgi:hypothetical protein
MKPDGTLEHDEPWKCWACFKTFIGQRAKTKHLSEGKCKLPRGWQNQGRPSKKSGWLHHRDNKFKNQGQDG